MKDKDNAPLLTALIVDLAGLVALPFSINPALATLAVLYLSKVGLEIFCHHTQPEKPAS